MVVMELVVLRQGFAKHYGGGGGVGGGRGCARGRVVSLMHLPTIYMAKGEGGAALPLPPRKGAAREESFPPKAPRRCLPP